MGNELRTQSDDPTNRLISPFSFPYNEAPPSRDGGAIKTPRYHPDSAWEEVIP
jgi:hypothetical protein